MSKFFQRLTKLHEPVARASAICGLWKKITSAYLFQTAREKIEIAYHNYAKAKRAHQVQK